MASVMGYGHNSTGYAPYNSNPAAAAAAAHSVQAHRVYVGNLPYTVGWRELKDFMRKAGDVSFAEVLIGPDGRSKGCGVVEFSTAEGAQKAIAELSDQAMLDRPIFIREDRESQPRYGHQPQRGFYGPHAHNNSYGRGGPRQLFVSGLPLTVTWRTLKDVFRPAGHVLRAEVTAGKGVGTVLMSTEEEAAAAIATFNGGLVEGSTIAVREDRYANANNTYHPGGSYQQNPRGHGHQFGQGTFHSATKPLATVDPSSQQPSTQVFVSNLPFTTDSASLMALCPTGAVHCEVLSIGGRSKGVGIIEYSTLEASAEALNTLQGQVIAGRPIKAKYNERWHEFSDQAVSAPL